MPRKDTAVFAEERKLQILNLVREKKQITINQICQQFGVSTATARNDLRDLQAQELLTRTHGGAIGKIQTGFELIAKDKQVHHLAEKRALAQAALDLIHDGDKIILDTGTTTLELARLLAAKKRLTVLTNDLHIARVLEEYAEGDVILLGGMLRKRFHYTTQIGCHPQIAGLRVDKAFMGANSFSLVSGASTPDILTAETKKNMIHMSHKVIILCDHSKIGQTSFAQFAALEQIDTLVVDVIEEKTRALFEENGVEVISAR